MRRLYFLFVLFRSSRSFFCIRPNQASLHLRRHDEVEARRRAGAFAGWQVGDLQRGRCRPGGKQEDAAHLDRAAECGFLHLQKDSSNPSASVGMTTGERILIPDQDGDRPRWAPDGKSFAFLSTKEEGSQIWIAGFEGTAGKVTAWRSLPRLLPKQAANSARPMARAFCSRRMCIPSAMVRPRRKQL